MKFYRKLHRKIALPGFCSPHFKHMSNLRTPQSTSPRIATIVLVWVPQGCAGQFGPHYIGAVPPEFYHGLDLMKWNGGTTDCFGLECAETASSPYRQSSTPSHTLMTEATENEVLLGDFKAYFDLTWVGPHRFQAVLDAGAVQ